MTVGDDADEREDEVHALIIANRRDPWHSRGAAVSRRRARIARVQLAPVVAADHGLDDLDAAVGAGQRVLELGPSRSTRQCGVRVAAHSAARSTPCGVPKSWS